MSTNNNENENITEYEDIISSSAPKEAPNVKSYVSSVIETVGELSENYSENTFNSLGSIIKFIAFIICFVIIGISFIAAYFVYSKLPVYTAISIGIVVIGTCVALVALFLIFGLGQLICQNNEILARLRNLTKKQ